MPDVLKIVICEDEPDQKNMLLELLDESNIENTSVVFANGEDLLADFKQGKYDLILMDIYMESELTGIDTIRLIRKKDKDIPVAFVTTSKDHALESYRLSAMKYIEKPYSKESIEDILHLALLKKNDVSPRTWEGQVPGGRRYPGRTPFRKSNKLNPGIS